MIVYTKRCLACSNRRMWKKLKQFVAKYDLSLQERRVGLKQEWANEARAYEIEMPFVVHNGIALSLTEDLEGLMQ